MHRPPRQPDAQSQAAVFARLQSPSSASTAVSSSRRGEISSLYDDCVNCTFQPALSSGSKASESSGPSFLERVPKSVARFHEIRNTTKVYGRPNDTTFTFQPKINALPNSARGQPSARSGHHASADCNSASSADSAVTLVGSSSSSPSSFLSRVSADLSSRSARCAELARAAAPSFHPTISEGSQRRLDRRSRARPSSFLDRLSEDLTQRDRLSRDLRRRREAVPCTFKPDLSSTQRGSTDSARSSSPSSSSFLSRMSSDTRNRAQSRRQRDEAMALKYVPPSRPQTTIAAMSGRAESGSNSTRGSGSSTLAPSPSRPASARVSSGVSPMGARPSSASR